MNTNNMNKHLPVFFLLFCLLIFTQSRAQSYDSLWSRFRQFDHYRVADANRMLDTIEWKALAENNEYRLLEVCFSRIALCQQYGNWYAKNTIKYIDSIRHKRGTLYQPVYDYSIGMLLQKGWDQTRGRPTGNKNYHFLDEWTYEEMTAEANKCFQRAMDSCDRLIDLPIADYPFITSDNWEQRPQACPTLFDLLLQSRIHLLKKYLKSTPEEIIQLYNKAIRIHKSPKDKEIRLFYELQRLQCLYDCHQMDSTSYEEALHNLEQHYGKDEDAILFAWALYYYQLDGTKFYYRAIPFLNALLHQSSDDYYIQNAHHYKEEIERKWLYIHGSQSDFYPNHHIPLCIAYRNVDTVYMSIYRTAVPMTISHVATKVAKAPHLCREDVQSLTKLVSKQLFVLPTVIPHDYHATDIWLDSLPVGSYVLLFHLEPKWDTSTVLMTKTLQITNVQLTGWHSNNYFFFAANNRRNGEALTRHRAVIRPYSVGLERLRRSDKNGQFKMVRKIHHGEWDGSIGLDFYNGRKDVYNTYYVDHSNYWDSKRIAKREIAPVEQIALDRTLYRPGQTLYYKVLLGSEGTAVTNQPVIVKLMDDHYTVLDSVQMTTNAFGSVAGNFQLPNKVGHYKIMASYWNKQLEKAKGSLANYWKLKKKKSFSTNFQVAEYRLPTFKVEALKDTNEYSFGDTIEVAGYAMTLADVPLDGAQVRIQCRIQDAAFSDRYVDTTVFCDARGRFVWKWITPMAHTSRFINAQIEMTVTDINGESHSAYTEYTLSDKSLFLEIALDKEVDKDTTDKLLWKIYAENADQVKLSVPLSLVVERITTPPFFKGQIFPKEARPTVWLHSEEAYAQGFSNQTLNEHFDLAQEWPVTDTMLQLLRVFDARKPLTVDVRNWPLGIYRVTVTGVDKHGEIVRKFRYVQLYDSKATKATLSQPVFVRMPSQVNLGDTLPVLVGASLKDAIVFCVAYQGERRIFSKRMPLSVEQQMLYVPTNKKNNVDVCVVAYAVQNGVSYHDICYQDLVMPEWKDPSNEMTVRLTHWNRSVEPGWQQEWEMEVMRTGSAQTDAEVLASMVDDAILQLHGDPVKEHISVWATCYSVPKQKSSIGFFGGVRSYSNHLFNCSSLKPLLQYRGLPLPKVEFEIPSDRKWSNSEYENLKAVTGRSVSYSLSEMANNNEVLLMYEPPVWAGSGSVEKLPSASSFAQQDVENATLRMDDFEDNPQHVVLHEVETIKDEKSASRENAAFAQNARLRNQFVETAFFYPQLRTDSTGHVKFAFSVPDQFTQWCFYATAHTKDLQFGDVFEDVVSRRSLMIQSNCPRFLCEGDTLSFAVKVSNLCDTALKGMAKISFFDPRTNQPLSLLLNKADSMQSFVSNAQGSTVVRWSMAVPEGVPAIAYRVLAQSGSYGDGEEKAIPVLSSRQVVTESKSFFVPADTTDVVAFEKMNDNRSASIQSLSFSVEVITNPVWTAVSALPYMAYERGNCNSLIASALYANALARHIARNFPEIEKTYAQWTEDTLNQSMESPLLRNEELKSLQLSETPWMRFAASEYQQRLDMANLFKHRRLNNEWNRLLTKLKVNQMPDGGWDWYGHDASSEYITAKIVTNYQKLQRMHLDVPEVNPMMRRALTFLDSCASRRYQHYLENKAEDFKYKYYLSQDDIRYLYARSFNTADTAWLQQPYARMIWSHLLENREIHPYELQAKIALALNRLGRQKEARNMVEGLRQQAFVSDQLGMYWRCKSQDVSRQIYQQVAMIEAFSEISPNRQDLDRMRQWLLLQKKGNQWPTTEATAEAVFALVLDDNQELLDPAHTQVIVGQQTYSSESDALSEAGTGRMMKVWMADEVTPALAAVTVHTDEEHPAMGNLFWQYVNQQAHIEASGNGITIERELCHQRVVNGQTQLVPVTDNDPARVGEHLTIRMVLRSTQDLEFVHVYDRRSAALEPLNFREQYRYIGNVYCYEVPHDASTSFFIKRLPMGTYVVEYEVVASQCGSFSNGIATVECAYAPEFRAQSEGKRIRCIMNNE